jgi:hypothetical protein
MQLLPDRMRKECLCRWHDAVDPRIGCTAPRSGRWTTGEVNALKKAVENYDGKDWNAVAALVPSRTKSQCRGRWHNALDTSVDPARSINIASRDAEETALPLADADSMTTTLPNTSVAGTLFLSRHSTTRLG